MEGFIDDTAEYETEQFACGAGRVCATQTWGKYSRLRRELSLVSRSDFERVCVVTVDETDGGPGFESDVAAAHSLGGLETYCLVSRRQ